MEQEFGTIVDEFVKNSPYAWRSLCAHTKAQAIWAILCWSFGMLVSTSTLFVSLRRASKGDAANYCPLLAIIACGAYLFLLVWAFQDGPDRFADLLAPEKGAAEEVIRLSGEAQKAGGRP